MASRSQSVLHALRAHARVQPGACALAAADRTFSYAELWDRILRADAWLGGLGAQPGDRVATALAPGGDHLALLLGAMHRGCIAAPLNTRLTSHELERYLAPLAPLVVVDEPPALDDVTPAGAEPAAGDIPALVIGTGGTTGAPKGALFTHDALWRWTVAAWAHQRVQSQAVELSATPFFHGFLVSGLMTALLAGATVRLMARFDPEQAIGAIEEHGVTRLSAPPTMLIAMAELLQASGRVGGLRTILFSSSDPPAGMLETLAHAFPRAELMTGYGTTEFGPAARLYFTDRKALAPGCVGRPIPTVDVSIRREDGSLAATGELGEIVVQTPWQMSGYFANPQETAAVFTSDGGIRPGDLGSLDEDGVLYLKGRSKDVICTGGENVFPGEVEAILGLHPAVAAVAVYGAPDAYWGERVEAAVVAREGTSVALEDLRVFARGQLAGYKLPKVVRLVDSLPLTANMKVSRRALREAVAGP